jgi:adenosylmethionine-8-amino-7-oxononanoate aminotransferase
MSGDVVAFSPPLIMEPGEIDALMVIVRRALDDTLDWVKR